MTLRFFGPSPSGARKGVREIFLPKGADAEALMVAVGFEPGDWYRVAVIVNGEKATPATGLQDGDEVEMVVLTGGG
ncbi:MAG: MoaD/ThiS family protein [Planctomycetota bacterium]